MVQALITLGSNIDKEVNIPAALRQMDAQSSMVLVAVSDVFETPAVNNDGEFSDQEAFHNAAVLIKTALPTVDLRSVLRTIEVELGRVRTADKFAARPIDLDIALYGDAVLNLEGSHIPDPDILRYPHVAVPLANVAPDWIHPITGDTLRQIAQRLAISKMEEVNV